MEVLKITDGTKTIDLLDKTKSFLLSSWRPQVPGFKGAGTFRDSPLADGRRLIDYRFENVIDVFNMKIRSEDQDTLIEETQELRRLLVKAVDYWRTNWQLEPVWIEAQASCETNKRYSLIFSFRTPEDDSPYSQPFLQVGKGAVMDEFSIAIEHGHWLANQPGTGDCVESAGYGSFCFPSYISFSDTDGEVDCGSNAAIDNLPLAVMTVEAWVDSQGGWGGGGFGRIFEKREVTGATDGWSLFLDQGNTRLEAHADYDVTNAISNVLWDVTAGWHHVAATFDPATDTWRIWIDGVEPAYVTQQAGANNYQVDAANDFFIGNRANGARNFGGNIGWTRISDSLRYNVDFAPPPRCELPDIDANTIAQWIYEGSGTAIDNQEGTAALDGTAANITWACDCTRFYGNVEIGCSPAYLEFNGDTSEVDCGSDAAIDDLQDDAFTAEAWIRANSFGESNAARIITKRIGGAGWELIIESTNGLQGLIDASVTDGDSRSGLDDFTPDGKWHHVAMTFDDAGTRLIRLFVDGVEPSYPTQTALAGAIITDVGNDLFIGNRSDGVTCMDGDIGWCRISDSLRYTTDFIPPDRCTLPTIDANTVAVWIYEGYGANADNLESTPALDGAIANAVWACDCEDVTQFDVLSPLCTLGGDSPTGGEFVTFVNKRNDANLTHIWFDDGGVFSSNLIFETADYDLLPPVPAVGDAVYFVINSTTPDSGPFNNLVFNIDPAQGDLTIAWEYWNGAWVALTNHDNTANDGNPGGEPFDSASDPRSVHWIPPADWVVSTVNAVTGYMVRARVTAIGGTPTPPGQDLSSAGASQIHSVTWPFTEVDDGDIAGDIPAINLTRLINWSDGNAVTFQANKVIVGLRSKSRDDPLSTSIFEAYFNLGDEQLVPFTFVADFVNTAVANDIEAPSGRVRIYTPGGVEAMADRVELVLASEAARSTAGRFRALLRGYQTGGVAGEIELELAIDLANVAVEVSISKVIATQNLLDWQLFDFGNITFPGDGLLNDSDQIDDIKIRLRASSASATPTFTFVDLILIPIDEFSGEFSDFDTEFDGFIGYQPSAGPSGITGRVTLDMDSVSLPKRRVRAPVTGEAGRIAIPTWEINAAGEVILQANEDQRYWFLVARGDSSGDLFWEPWLFHSVWLNANQQYLSMRGDR